MTRRPLQRDATFLRRYARALTGRHDEGDAFVQETLRALIEGELELDDQAALRPALFRAFHQTWRKALNGHSIDAPRSGLVADRRLQRMTPEHRSVLLLVLMEGFSLAEAAYILGLSEDAAAERLEIAQRSVEQQLATGVLIIEDEPPIALDLSRMVEDMGHRVLGVADTRSAANELAARSRPGLVLADVRLADGSSGIDAATDILARVDVPVIFITAYPERLLTGKRPEPTFMIAKPFTERTVKALVGQALFFHQPRPSLQVL